MSKVEKALQKARAVEGLREISPALEGSQQLVPKRMELMPFRHEISRMREPWLLSRADMAEERIIFPEMKDVAVIDAFRAIRTRILQESPGGNCSVLVTSVMEDGGTSFVALNLAVSFTLDSAKTSVLVDCNLREPSFDFLTAGDGEQGLTDLLEAPDLDPTLVVHPAGIPRLRLIPAGRSSELATEHLESKRLKEFLGAVRQRYPDRYMIIDSANIATTSDAQVLMNLCDFVLLVVPYGKVSESQIWQAAQAIDERKFLGIVFNNEPRMPTFGWN